MLIALIALITLTLTGLALFRTVDSGVLVGGNLAMKNSAMRSGDSGIQRAANWLYSINATAPATLAAAAAGYSAFGLTDDQTTCANLTWADCWTALSGLYAPVSLGTDGAGNTVQYLVQRLCDPAGNCAQTQQGCDDTAKGPEQCLRGSGATYYRITVDVTGPRNTASRLQAMVAP